MKILSAEETIQKTKNYNDYLIKLMGVINANVVYSGNEIVEVHILADTSRSPKQIVRDVQSLFMAQFNQEIDHRIISVAQIDSDIAGTNKVQSRYVIEGLTVGKKRDRTEIEVSLSLEDKLFVGKSTALKDSQDLYRGVAQATLSAVAQASETIESYSVLDVRFSEIAGDRMAISCVSLTSEKNTGSRFTGSAFSTHDDEMAVVRATLNAINRRIAYI